MSPDDETHRIYQNYRDIQRERILEAAELLFIRDGIDHVSMSAIASAARMSRKTIYKYFPDRRSIAWAIFQKILEKLKEQIIGITSSPHANGFTRLESFVMGMDERIIIDAEHSRFIVEFNSLYARENNPETMRQVIEQTWSGAYDQFAKLIRDGIEDGSLRQDLDPERASAALLNMLNAVNSRFALLGSQIEKEYKQPVTGLYQEICRVFLRGLQSDPTDHKIGSA